MKYDFTTLPDRHGRGLHRPVGPGWAKACTRTTPAARLRMPSHVGGGHELCLPAHHPAGRHRAVQHPAFGYFDPTPEYYGSIIRWQETRNDVTGLTARPSATRTVCWAASSAH